MIIAHLPAGYLLTRLSWLRGRRLVPWVMVGSVCPDLDMFWFHLVDQGHTHHHNYLTHRPATWGALIVLACAFPKGWLRTVLNGIGIGGVLHVMLDSVSGRIDWAWPIGRFPVTLIEVAPRFDWWVWSFLTSTTFAIECLIICVAGAVFWRHLLRR